MMDLVLGVLDIISEIAKLISLSFRLFGNVIAGELIIIIISGLSFYTRAFVPIPFMALSIISGVVQALVFAMLSIQFIAGSVNAAEESAAGKSDSESDDSVYDSSDTRGEIQVKI
jgi:F0F1-type ATP synthase membrane subunit a